MDCSRGFSLHDLLITLAIGSILVTTGAGASRLVSETSQTAEINTFIAHLHLARSAAVTRQRDVVLCPSDDGRRCNGTDDVTWWHGGVLLFLDDNGNRQVDVNDIVLQRHTPMDAHLRIKSSRYRTRVVYQPSGLAGGTNLTFTFCAKRDAANATARYVVVSNTGRARVSTKPADGRADQREETCV